MFEIIKMKSRDGEMIQAVDARILWKNLGSKTQFRDWILRREKDAGLIEGQDFIISLENERNLKSGRPQKNVILSIEAAKHLAMMEGTEKGKEIRQYFIDVEKEERQMAQARIQQTEEQEAAGCFLGWMQVASILEVPAHLAQIEAAKAAMNKTGIDFFPLLLAAPAQENIKEEEVMLEPADMATAFGITGSVQERGRGINRFLEYIEWQYRENGEWKPTATGEKYCAKHSWSVGTKSGYNLKWNKNAVKKEWDKIHGGK